MHLQFVTKKVGPAYEAALVVNGRFARTGSASSLKDLLLKLAGADLEAQQEEGAEITVSITITGAEEIAREEAAQELAKEKAAAEKELQGLDALAEVRKKIADKRASMGAPSGQTLTR